MGSNARTDTFRSATSLFLGIALASAVALSGTIALAQASGTAPKAVPVNAAQAAAQTNYDVLMFKDGKIVEGIVISETKSMVKFKREVAGITIDDEFSKADILNIKRGAGAVIGTATDLPASLPANLPAAPAWTAGASAPASAATNSTQPVKQGGVYWITLTGHFAQQITQTPIRDSLKDAKKYRPDIIIFEVDNEVIPVGQRAEDSAEMEKLYAEIDELFRAEKMLPITVTELPYEWGYKPRIVYWVKRAYGGMAFMPLTGKEIYFSPEGKLGGVGNLDDYIRAGHRRVVEKQMSLRLQHAVGWVNHSGFPNPELLTRALVKESTVVSVRFEEGRPVLFEGWPSNPSEELLTDDGKGSAVDTIDLLARGLGNDVLTLDERTAKLIGLSKGTVASRDELLSALGVSSDDLIKGTSDRIFKDWATGLERAYPTAERLIREYNEAVVQGNFNERRSARSTRIQKLEQLKSLGNRWGEGLDPRRLQQSGIPAGGDGMNTVVVQQTIDDLRLQQSLDRR